MRLSNSRSHPALSAIQFPSPRLLFNRERRNLPEARCREPLAGRGHRGNRSAGRRWRGDRLKRRLKRTLENSTSLNHDSTGAPTPRAAVQFRRAFIERHAFDFNAHSEIAYRRNHPIEPTPRAPEAMLPIFRDRCPLWAQREIQSLASRRLVSLSHARLAPAAEWRT